MDAHHVQSFFRALFLLLAAVYLFTGAWGLLGFPVVLPTKFSGLKRFTGRSARVAGGVAVFGGVMFLFIYYLTFM